MILNLRKPSGITSHDMVEIVRRLTGEARVGHGGTLDPFAEGVLVIGAGRESTKKLHRILKGTDKEYIATLKLGETSTTGDPEGKIKITAPSEKIAEITNERLAMSFSKFIGEIEQTPPAYSALKIKGVPAYKLARRGETPILQKRKVIIRELELVEYDPPLIRIRTVVSSGTYIRSLAEDIGRALGVGAYLQELTRTRVGEFKIEDSKTLEGIEKLLKNGNTKK
ncbi:MAG: tRNA pseudouridine(55) synthase TruB [Candidatus Colwellbacteria bacterium]|nr:tRNA pseudouridine(55) synthase TruB [Candidatus Colwellbacteria bacterium]